MLLFSILILLGNPHTHNPATFNSVTIIFNDKEKTQNACLRKLY
jgi:hypothetical protein